MDYPDWVTVSVYRVRPIGQEVVAGQPGYGPTFGLQLVEIAGNGFAVSPDGQARVRVRFGTQDAVSVRVVGTGLIRAQTPPTPILTVRDTNDVLISDGTGFVDVEVQVLDDDGDPVLGEVGTLIDGYEYRRETIHDAKLHVYAYYTASLMQQLSRDFLPNVVFTTKSIDYVNPSVELPNVVLAGLSDVESDERVTGFDVFDGADQLVAPTSGLLLGSEVDIYDLIYPVEVYVDESSGGSVALLNLMSQLRLLVKRRPFLDVPCDLQAPTQGIVARNRLEWDPGAPTSIPRDVANESGLYWLTGTLRVYGVELRGGTFAGTGLEDVVSQIQRVLFPADPC